MRVVNGQVYYKKSEFPLTKANSKIDISAGIPWPSCGLMQHQLPGMYEKKFGSLPYGLSDKEIIDALNEKYADEFPGEPPFYVFLG